MKSKNHYSSLFWQLLKTDLYTYKEAIYDGFVDVTIWFSTTILVFTYIFPSLGMTKDYAPFIAVGAIVSCSFWDVWATATNFVADIEGNKTIDYFLTLPLPNWLLLIKQIIGYALKAGIPALIILPLGKILLWNKINFHQFSLFKFTLIFILMNIFVGTFSLTITSYVHNLHQVGKIGVRIIFPMWFLSGSNYPWQTINKISPLLGKISLCNPLLYAMEGTHAAVLGQEGYLSYWLCIGILIISIVLFAWLGIRKLKKRLDFV